MEEAWSFLGGAMTGFAFAVFLGWCWSYREKAKQKRTASKVESVRSQDFTLTHTDKRVFLTFTAPSGYHYEDVEDGALVAQLPGINVRQDEAAA